MKGVSKTMDCKFTPGQYWRTRNGQRAYITGVTEVVNPFTGEELDFPVIAVIHGEGDQNLLFTLNGEYYFKSGRSGYDLIEPWEDEPPQDDGYPDGTVYVKSKGKLEPFFCNNGEQVMRCVALDRRGE